MKKISIHVIVHGKVQGVFFRDGTQKQAVALNIDGWVKNNSNNTVELKASGEPEKIQQLIEWLHHGPPRAVVTQVEWHEIDEITDQGFVVKHYK